MKVGIISGGVPHPSRGASLVLIYRYIAALRDAGHTLVHAVLASQQPTQEALDEYWHTLAPAEGSELRVFPGPPLFSSSRFRVERHETKLPPLRHCVEVFGPDAIVCFDLEAAAAAAPLQAPLKTVWLGDLNFRSMWYNYLYGFREAPWTARWLPYALVQMREWRKIYAESLAGFDPIIVSSKSSETDLAALGLDSLYRPYPWPVPEAEASIHRDEREELDRPTFLFFGNLTGLGSRSAFHFMFRRVIPRLRRIWSRGGFRILIAGHAEMRDWVRQRIEETSEVEFLGFVDDLPALVARCHAVLAPLDVPVGNRSRILTAMALGGLVIAHENASLGNPSLKSGHNALLFRTADEMAEHMVAVVREPAAFTEVIAAARRTYREEFAPEVAAPLFADIVAAAGSRTTRVA